MLDVKKLNCKVKLAIISLWIEQLQKKDVLTDEEKEATSIICDYILEEVLK